MALDSQSSVVAEEALDPEQSGALLATSCLLIDVSLETNQRILLCFDTHGSRVVLKM